MSQADPPRFSEDQPWPGPAARYRPALIPPVWLARLLLILIVAASIYFFQGFLVPVLAALVIGFASWPLYRRLQRRVGGSTIIAATLALLLVIAFLVVPIVLAMSYAITEVGLWLTWLVQTNRNGAPTPDWIAALPGVGEWLDVQWSVYIGHPGAIGELAQLVAGENIGSIYNAVLATGTRLAGLALALVFMLIALFFVYKDGARIAGQLDRVGERVFPARWARISRLVPATISSTVIGMTLIAIGEGIVLGVAYWIAGVPSALTLGVLTGFMALIPGGAPLSFTLVSLYLVASGSPLSGLALFVWGSTELFIVDKTIRPKIVGGPIKLPFLPTFFGLIGGVSTMGFVGLFIGPVLMAVLVAIWREWQREIDIADGGGALPVPAGGPAPDPEPPAEKSASPSVPAPGTPGAPGAMDLPP